MATMHRNVYAMLALIVAIGCGGQGDGSGNATDDCALSTIVRERVSPEAVDCSQNPDEGSGPAKIQCIAAAQAASTDAFWLSERTSGIDSLLQRAMIVKANGETFMLDYDSHPGGGGTGADTVSSRQCASFATSPDLACSDATLTEQICSFGRRVD